MPLWKVCKGERMTEEIKNLIIDEYIKGKSVRQISNQYRIGYSTVKKCLLDNNIPKNYTDRSYQKYENCGEYTKIFVKCKGEYVECLIDTEDVDKCKNVGIWSITKAGYIVNCASKIYIHRLVMDCPENIEVDHIYHNPLDNRKSQLRYATSSQQKMNTKIRCDNSSGHRGVYYDKSRNTWNVNINFQNESFHKRFKNFDDAVNMADNIYNKYFGEYKYKSVEGN